jgi:hypothetical protein
VSAWSDDTPKNFHVLLTRKKTLLHLCCCELWVYFMTGVSKLHVCKHTWLSVFPILICKPKHQFINGSYGMFSVTIAVTLCTDRFNARNAALCSQRTYLLHMMVTINKGCFPIQHSKSGHSNERTLCNLCITQIKFSLGRVNVGIWSCLYSNTALEKLQCMPQNVKKAPTGVCTTPLRVQRFCTWQTFTWTMLQDVQIMTVQTCL